MLSCPVTEAVCGTTCIDSVCFAAGSSSRWESCAKTLCSGVPRTTSVASLRFEEEMLSPGRRPMQAPTSVASPPRTGAGVPGILPARKSESTCSSRSRVLSTTEYSVRNTSGLEGEASLAREVAEVGSSERTGLAMLIVWVFAGGMQAGLRRATLYRTENSRHLMVVHYGNASMMRG